MFTHCSFNSKKIKHSFYRSGDCMKKLLADLRSQVSKIINGKEKKYLSQRNKTQKEIQETKTLPYLQRRIQ